MTEVLKLKQMSTGSDTTDPTIDQQIIFHLTSYTHLQVYTGERIARFVAIYLICFCEIMNTTFR